MSRAALSVLVFGVYMIAAGATLAVTPNTLLGIFGVPPATDPWIRVLGVVVITLGGYYVVAARTGVVAFFQMTIWGRACAFAGFCTLAALSLAPVALVAFGALDAAGALWTWRALQAPAGS